MFEELDECGLVCFEIAQLPLFQEESGSSRNFLVACFFVGVAWSFYFWSSRKYHDQTWCLLFWFTNLIKQPNLLANIAKRTETKSSRRKSCMYVRNAFVNTQKENEIYPDFSAGKHRPNFSWKQPIQQVYSDSAERPHQEITWWHHVGVPDSPPPHGGLQGLARGPPWGRGGPAHQWQRHVHDSIRPSRLRRARPNKKLELCSCCADLKPLLHSAKSVNKTLAKMEQQVTDGSFFGEGACRTFKNSFIENIWSVHGFVCKLHILCEQFEHWDFSTTEICTSL